MDCSPPGSTVHGISQARILEWVAVSFSEVSSQPRDRTHSLLHWQAASLPEPPGKPSLEASAIPSVTRWFLFWGNVITTVFLERAQSGGACQPPPTPGTTFVLSFPGVGCRLQLYPGVSRGSRPRVGVGEGDRAHLQSTSYVPGFLCAVGHLLGPPNDVLAPGPQFS